jgi:hypothetical protein
MRTLERPAPTRKPNLSTLEGDVPADLLEFTQAMQQYKHRSGRMFPTWSEVLEVLYDLGYRKPFHHLVATSRALITGTRDCDDHSCVARLLDIGPNRAVLTCAGPPPRRGPVRFCLLEPIPTRWAEAIVVAVEASGMGPVRVELSVSHGAAWGDILQAVWPE